MTQPNNTAKPEFATKTELRKILIEKRKKTDLFVLSHWDQQIGQHLLKWLITNQLTQSIVGVYSPIQQEPNLNNAYQSMIKLGIQLALPIVSGKNQGLKFAKWSPHDKMVNDKYGIPIPSSIQLTTPQILLIPCVGFNSKGYRLGYGGGYYDRTLAEQLSIIAVGIAHSQAYSEFESENFDMPMHHVITEISFNSFA